MRALLACLVLILAPGLAQAAQPQWISQPGAMTTPVVLEFQREVTYPTKPGPVWVRVSADNRFILHVNGQRVASGPATSDLNHWRYARLDLAPYLRKGSNTLTATVWNFVIPGEDDLNRQTGPLLQQSAGTGFYLETEDPAHAALNTGADWQVRTVDGHSAASAYAQLNGKSWHGYYIAGAPEIIDTRKAALPWTAAVAVASTRTLTPDPLPAMTYRATQAGGVVRGGHNLPVTIPAHSQVRLLIRRDDMVAAYPRLIVSGGRDAVIHMTYAEALYDKNGQKGERDEVGDRVIKGVTDTFMADGKTQTFAPLHWRVWRFVEIEVTTADMPLKLERLEAYETGYPFEQKGYFDSDDEGLNRIWQIGWRTARLDAHETYMDSAYWEQLQYVGDTRLQMLISYAVSGDARLAVNAIDAIGWSDSEGGLTEGAYPSRGNNVIAPFSLLWIGMMHDWWLHQPDTAVISRNLPRARRVLAWFRPYLGDDGLLTRNPTWNFVDWVGKERDAFPSFDADNRSCMTSLIYLGALREAADLETALGDPTRATDNAALAARISAGVQALCWDTTRGLYADDPSKTLFSQHTSALAVLYGVAPADQAKAILGRITTRGISAPDGVIPVSHYFAWYLVRAHEKAGLGERYIDLMQGWRDLLPLNFSTWPEAPMEARSDSHAWTGHPTEGLLSIMAGIRPGAPGYASVRIEPHLGSMKRLKARAMTPTGPVTVDYTVGKQGFVATITSPLPGEFLWQGKVYELKAGVTTFRL